MKNLEGRRIPRTEAYITKVLQGKFPENIIKRNVCNRKQRKLSTEG